MLSLPGGTLPDVQGHSAPSTHPTSHLRTTLVKQHTCVETHFEAADQYASAHLSQG